MAPATPDREEGISLLAPMLIGETSRHEPEPANLVLEVATRSAGFRRSVLKI